MNATTSPCERLKALLIEHGEFERERHPDLAAHADDCTACRRLLAAWNAVPDLLDELPEHEPDEALMEKVRTAVDAAPARATAPRRRYLAPSLASAAILLAAVGISHELLMRESPRVPAPAPVRSTNGEPLDRALPSSGRPGAREQDLAGGRFYDADADAPGNSLQKEKRQREAQNQADPALREAEEERFEWRAADNAKTPMEGERTLRRSKAEALSNRRNAPPPPAEAPADRPVSTLAAEPASKQATDEFAQRRESRPAGEGAAEITLADDIALDSKQVADARRSEPKKDRDIAARSPKTPAQQAAPAESNAGEVITSASNGLPEAMVHSEERPAAEASMDRLGQTETQSKAGGAGDMRLRTDPAHPSAISGLADATGAFDFLGHYSRMDNLSFRPATGYWANTHVPGDPAMRLLNARLADWGHSGPRPVRPDTAVEPVAQPFDAPDDNALALSLMADVSGIPARADDSQQPTRFRMQVGLKGIEHRAGLRPAMNLAVVLDLPPDATDAVRIGARALLDALQESHQAGDRFALVMPGNSAGFDGLVVPPEDFRHGPLQQARDVIAQVATVPVPGSPPRTSGAPTTTGEPIDITAGFEQAARLIRDSQAPDAPLGSSAILLITGRELPALDRLVTLTHAHATDGITTSVVPLGPDASNDQAKRLVLAGLGNRRYLETPAAAGRLVQDELHAASRAVARAARLSIRLAPGVRLVEVIGSHRLDEPQAQRVRDIENAIDRRLAADRGIAADRGEDEDGIQIVIPAIHSGDSVTVLLDLLTDRPGPIADVTLRYKDLVRGRNGSLSAQLELPRADTASAAAERGPAQLAVLKNLLTHHFSAAVEQAAEALGRGRVEDATAILRGMHATIGQARRDLPAWSEDPDLIRDQQVLERYIDALESPQGATELSYLADSLRLAAFAKQHGLPQEWK